MRRKSTQILSILLVLVVVLAAAGCGKKKSSTTTSTTTTTTTAAAATTTAGGSTSTETTATAPTTTSAAAGLGALASAANCKSIADLGSEFSKALQGANGDVQKEVALFQQFAAKTPSDIRPDFETIANALAKVADALKGVNLSGGGTPDAATLAKLAAVGQQINTPAVTQAEKNISAWAAKNCHA
ncbi:MAG TPA: hypothetical protein VLV28_11430 [Gaiellaceae bacterium]|nr:hypothetical protein [Gaiellaceae bacterium]